MIPTVGKRVTFVVAYPLLGSTHYPVRIWRLQPGSVSLTTFCKSITFWLLTRLPTDYWFRFPSGLRFAGLFWLFQSPTNLLLPWINAVDGWLFLLFWFLRLRLITRHLTVLRLYLPLPYSAWHWTAFSPDYCLTRYTRRLPGWPPHYCWFDSAYRAFPFWTVNHITPPRCDTVRDRFCSDVSHLWRFSRLRWFHVCVPHCSFAFALVRLPLYPTFAHSGSQFPSLPLPWTACAWLFALSRSLDYSSPILHYYSLRLPWFVTPSSTRWFWFIGSLPAVGLGWLFVADERLPVMSLLPFWFGFNRPIYAAYPRCTRYSIVIVRSVGVVLILITFRTFIFHTCVRCCITVWIRAFSCLAPLIVPCY